MDSKPFLSICIPTRDRAQCLRELLESIVSQATPEIEIVISDDGSTDETPRVIAEFRDRFPHFVSDRHDPALRYDRNVLHVVAKASGDYCWLFGDDDKMEPGGLAPVLAALRANPDLTGLTTDRIAYDSTLSERIYVRALTLNETCIFKIADKRSSVCSTGSASSPARSSTARAGGKSSPRKISSPILPATCNSTLSRA